MAGGAGGGGGSGGDAIDGVTKPPGGLDPTGGSAPGATSTPGGVSGASSGPPAGGGGGSTAPAGGGGSTPTGTGSGPNGTLPGGETSAERKMGCRRWLGCCAGAASRCRGRTDRCGCPGCHHAVEVCYMRAAPIVLGPDCNDLLAQVFMALGPTNPCCSALKALGQQCITGMLTDPSPPAAVSPQDM